MSRVRSAGTLHHLQNYPVSLGEGGYMEAFFSVSFLLHFAAEFWRMGGPQTCVPGGPRTRVCLGAPKGVNPPLIIEFNRKSSGSPIFLLSTVTLMHFGFTCFSFACYTGVPGNLSFHYIHCTGQFTPKMKANAEPRLLSSLV